MPDLNLKPLASQHLGAVWAIESGAHSHPWKRSMIDDLNSRGAMHYGLFDGEVLCGYFYAQDIVGEVTLLNIAIDPLRQGQGLGRTLMEEFIELATQKGTDSIWLEVRESNQRAQSLYLDVGFNQVDVRKNYYPTEKGREDAIIMSYLCL